MKFDLEDEGLTTGALNHRSNLIGLASVSSGYKSSLGLDQVVGWSNLAVSMHPHYKQLYVYVIYISQTSSKVIQVTTW